MTDRERALFTKVLSRLLRAVNDLDQESTFRNIASQELNDLYCDIYELRDGKRPEIAREADRYFPNGVIK